MMYRDYLCPDCGCRTVAVDAWAPGLDCCESHVCRERNAPRMEQKPCEQEDGENAVMADPKWFEHARAKYERTHAQAAWDALFSTPGARTAIEVEVPFASPWRLTLGRLCLRLANVVAGFTYRFTEERKPPCL